MKYSQLKQFSWSRADTDHLLPLTYKLTLHIVPGSTKIFENCKETWIDNHHGSTIDLDVLCTWTNI